MMINCPISGCNQQLPVNQAFCAFHWARIPGGLRRDIGNAWHGYLTRSGHAANDAKSRFDRLRARAITLLQEAKAYA